MQQTQRRAEENLQQRESGLSVEKDTLQQQIMELEQKCNEWREMAEDKCAQVAQLNIAKETQDVELQQMTEARVQLEQEKKALEGEMESIRKEKEELTKCSDEQISALKQSMDMSESDSRKAFDEVVVHKQELETKLNEFEEEMKQFQDKYEQLNRDSEEKIVGLEGQCREQDTKVMELQQEVEGLSTEKVQWAEEKMSLEGRIQVTNEEIQLKSGELETCRAEIAEKEQEIGSLNEKFNEMEAKYTVRKFSLFFSPMTLINSHTHKIHTRYSFHSFASDNHDLTISTYSHTMDNTTFVQNMYVHKGIFLILALC